MAGELTPRDWISATLAKSGHRPEENEDAIAAAPERFRFAVADGATEGWESARWSAHLVGTFIRRCPTPADFSEWLSSVRSAWQPRTATGPVAWYAAEKQEQGSFATLVGMELRPAPDGTWGWKAVAIGDSCLIHVRDGNIEASFPLSSRSEFGDRPPLVPSSSARACPPPSWLAGRAQPGDLLLLATDAAAAHLLEPTALDFALLAIGEAISAGHSRPIAAWLREVQVRVNDDTSLVALRIPAA
jgi:hypothetical protein